MPVGQLRFIVPDPARLSERAVQQAFLSGLDPIPNACRAKLTGGELLVERDGYESTKLNVPWRIDGRGEPLMATATVVQRDRPYLLPLELARGKVNQVRNQLADWLTLGLTPSEKATQRLAEATRLFTRAAVAQHDVAEATAGSDAALVAACEAGDLLSQNYVDQALITRHRATAKLPVAFGASLGHREPNPAKSAAFASICNTAVVPLTWRDVVSLEEQYLWDAYLAQIAWCKEHNINVAAGPLIRLDDRGFPDWLSLWQSDIDGILAFTAEYVSHIVRKLRGQVALWHAASYAARHHTLGLKDEDKLRIIVRALETVRRHDPDAPLIVSFDQPWGEYLRRVPSGYAPIQVADHLVRSSLPIAALGLELEVGYTPEGTYHRDALELGKILDVWSSLGLPLYIYLTVPSGETPDAAARSKTHAAAGVMSGGWSPESQARWVRDFVPLLLAKPAVQGIAWLGSPDDEPHDLPHGGLFDALGKPKPALTALASLRKEHVL
jgi:hypothetical protein